MKSYTIKEHPANSEVNHHAGITGQEQVARKVCGMRIIIQGTISHLHTPYVQCYSISQSVVPNADASLLVINHTH